MSAKSWNLLKFFIWLVVWAVVGFFLADRLRQSFVNTYLVSSGFHWVHTIIVLTITGASGSYWVYVQQIKLAGARTRFKAAFTFHLGAFAVVALSIGIYTLFDNPLGYNWLFWLVGWGIVVAVHGILSRRIQDAPEDLFV